MTLPLPLMVFDDPTRAAPWQWQQWVGFAIYGVILLGITIIAWRLSGPCDRPPNDQGKP